MKSKLFLGIAAVLALASCNPSTPAATTTEESKATSSAAKSSEDASSQASSAAGTSQASEPGKESEQYGSEGSQEEISTPAGEDSSAPAGEDSSAPVADPYKLLKEFNASLLSDQYDMVFLLDLSTTTLPLFAVNNFGKQGFRFAELDLQTGETSVTGIGAIGDLGYWDYVVVYEDEENPNDTEDIEEHMGKCCTPCLSVGREGSQI